jgi:glucokinase
VTADRCCAVGIDVGATKVAAGVVSFPSGRMTASRRIPTEVGERSAATLDAVRGIAEELAVEARGTGLRFVGIGCGVAELVTKDGRIASEHLIEWRSLPVSARLSEVAPAVLDADIRAAALAEARFGAGRELDWFAYLSLGTGIGLVLVEDGRPLAGATGAAGTLGYGPLWCPCERCGGETDLRIEEVASGRALASLYADAAGRPTTRAEDVFAARGRGEVIAAGIIRRGATALGSAVAAVADLVDPRAIVVGGGLGLAEDYADMIEAAARERIWNGPTRELAFTRAALGVDAGVIGAAALAVDRLGEAA